MRGRKPRPANLLKAAGNFRADRHGEGGVNMNTCRNAHPPIDFTAEEVGVWDEFAPTLTRFGLLKVADAPLFEIFVRELCRWRRLERMVRETGGEVIMVAGVPKANPCLREQQRARDAVLAIAREFGMSPSARRNVKASDGSSDLVGDLMSDLHTAEVA